jgi:hypothetical protein
MNGKIEQEGFVSEYEYQELHNGDQSICSPTSGHFVVLEDDPTALFLFDDDKRVFHNITSVGFLHRISNAIEGEKLYPRPWVTRQTDKEKEIIGYKYGSIVVSAGDKVIINYVNGSIYNPLVVGSVEPFGAFNQNNFLLTKPDEMEQEKKRLETNDYSLEYKNDSHGEITLDIVAKDVDEEKKNQGGTGNITINLWGTPGNGAVTLNMNGIATINQVDSEGLTTQRLLLDNTEDKNVARISQGSSTKDDDGNETFNEVQYVELDQENKTISAIQKSDDASEVQQSVIMDNGAKTITVLDVNKNQIETSEDGIAMTTEKKFTVTATGDVIVNTEGNATVKASGDTNVETSGDLKATASGNATITATKITLNSGGGKILTDLTATPACLFSGKPFPGVPTCEAG